MDVGGEAEKGLGGGSERTEYSRPSGLGDAGNNNSLDGSMSINHNNSIGGGSNNSHGGGGWKEHKYIRLLNERIRWLKEWWVVEKATTYAHTYADHFKGKRASQLCHNQLLRRRRSIAMLAFVCAVGMFFWKTGQKSGFAKGSGSGGAGGTKPSNNDAFAGLHHKRWIGAPSGQQQIPKKIHQTWKDNNIPWEQQAPVESWKTMNPHYQYYFYTDADIDAHMRKMHPEMLPAWVRMKPIEKADTFRYAILLDEGGIYADLDVTCLQPVDKWLQHTGDYGNVELLVGFEITTNRHDWKLWFARQIQVNQWTMAGVKGHPVFADILFKIAEYYATHTNEERDNTSVVQTTGPGPWSDAVLEYIKDDYNMTLGEEPLPLDTLSERITHIGSAMLLPIRAFALGSADYALKAHHSMDDVFIKHGFKGSWKKNYVNYDTANTWQAGGANTQAWNPVDTCTTAGDRDAQLQYYCGNGNSPVGENADNLFDGSIITKWLVFFSWPAEALTAEKAPHATFKSCITADADAGECKGVNAQPFAATWYSLSAGNDHAKRDPKAWIVEGKIGDGNWTVVDERANITFVNRSDTLRFNIAKPLNYDVYRIAILEIADKTSTSMQLAEFFLENKPKPPPPKPTCNELYGQNLKICACCGHIPAMEGVDKLFDGKSDTKLLFEPKIEDVNGYNITITSLPKPTSEPLLEGQVADTSVESTAIFAYAMTSANDFPGRDPKHFILKARNVGNTDWVTLDVQTNATFANRFETKTFNIAPATGVWDETGTLGTWNTYSEYMITIVNVFDLSEKHCGSFFCVQFSELGMYAPGGLPTTSTTTTTTTIEQPWAALPIVSNWPFAPSAYGVTEWTVRVTAGGTVQWKFGSKSNLISGTEKEPDSLFGFLMNKPAGFEYNHTFEVPGEYPFFASSTGVKGVVVVGGPPTTIPQPWASIFTVDAWPNAPAAAAPSNGNGFAWASSQANGQQSRILARITPGGTVVWDLKNRSNLIAGTPSEPDDLFGFYINKAAGAQYRFTFYKRGKYPFYSTTTGTQGMVEVGGPEPPRQEQRNTNGNNGINALAAYNAKRFHTVGHGKQQKAKANPHPDTFYADGRPIHEIPAGVNEPADSEKEVPSWEDGHEELPAAPAAALAAAPAAAPEGGWGGRGDEDKVERKKDVTPNETTVKPAPVDAKRQALLAAGFDEATVNAMLATAMKAVSKKGLAEDYASKKSNQRSIAAQGEEFIKDYAGLDAVLGAGEKVSNADSKAHHHQQEPKQHEVPAGVDAFFAPEEFY